VVTPPVPVSVGTVHVRDRELAVSEDTIIVDGAIGSIAGINDIVNDSIPYPR
jgi:hypothetical protein